MKQPMLSSTDNQTDRSRRPRSRKLSFRSVLYLYPKEHGSSHAEIRQYMQELHSISHTNGKMGGTTPCGSCQGATQRRNKPICIIHNYGPLGRPGLLDLELFHTHMQAILLCLRCPQKIHYIAKLMVSVRPYARQSDQSCSVTIKFT